MQPPFERLAGLDRLIHEPARLAILTALSQAESVDFLFLQRLTGLTSGNLSSHLSKLEEGGLISVQKKFVGKTPKTTIRLLRKGREAVTAHWRMLEELKQEIDSWQAKQSPA